ncbi:MAG: NUDIX domain-containing protein [Ruminococcus sp.]|nr:NUDIX domain-containing protein [Ruminococcus sp.]
MLANKVTVNIFGKLSKDIYSGYTTVDKNAPKKAYVLSDTPVNESFKGIVIALASFNDNEERLIVAPENTVYYEPDIRVSFSYLRNAQLTSVKCLYEKSCGGIVFYKGKTSTRILLVKNNNGRYWSFPKGHIEIGETEEETAIREIKEETSLDVEIKEGFREISDYCPYGKIHKRVVFFLAQAFTDNVVVQEEEIAEYIWVDLQQARKLCTYDNDLRIISKAETVIKLSCQ